MTNKANKTTKTTKTKGNSEAAKEVSSVNATHDEKVAKIIGTLTAIIVVVALITFVAVYSAHKRVKNPDAGIDLSEYTTAIDNVQTKPEGASDTYGLNISKNGYNDPVKGVPTVGIYMDFMCPGCGNFERTSSDNIEKMVNAVQINVEYHFMNFLDQASPDKYSTRAANAAIYIAQKSPRHLLKFISKMMSEEVQPQENSDSTPSNADIVKYAEGAGVPKDIAKESVKAGYSEWISAVNKYTTKRPSLYNLSGDYAGKSMSTPAITINGKLIDTVKSEDKGISVNDALLKSLGIAKNKVGNENYKIGLGDTGEPIPFK